MALIDSFLPVNILNNKGLKINKQISEAMMKNVLENWYRTII